MRLTRTTPSAMTYSKSGPMDRFSPLTRPWKEHKTSTTGPRPWTCSRPSPLSASNGTNSLVSHVAKSTDISPRIVRAKPDTSPHWGLQLRTCRRRVTHTSPSPCLMHCKRVFRCSSRAAVVSPKNGISSSTSHKTTISCSAGGRESMLQRDTVKPRAFNSRERAAASADGGCSVPFLPTRQKHFGGG